MKTVSFHTASRAYDSALSRYVGEYVRLSGLAQRIVCRKVVIIPDGEHSWALRLTYGLTEGSETNPRRIDHLTWMLRDQMPVELNGVPLRVKLVGSTAPNEGKRTE